MTREKIVAALREHAEWAAGNEWETPITLGDDLSAAADLIENQQREIEALRQANEGLRFHLAALHGSGGHPDPVGPKGQMAECPVCGGMCDWAPETDISTCRACGYTNGTAQKSVDRLREIAEADKAGRVAILPCEVGDTLWIAGSVRGLYSAKVRTFFCGHPSAERGTDDDGGVQMIRTTECDIPIGNFGKTVFLTREEAEAALHGFGGHPDPVGLKGQMAECPVCGGMCDWAPETDISTCRVCGYTNGKTNY